MKLPIQNHLVMQSHFKKHLIKSCLLVIITLISYSVAFTQETDQEREITEAINNVNTGNYKEAIPVLKKYIEIEGFDDFKTLEITIYLNWCYFETKDKAFDVEKINKQTEAYAEKFGISKIDNFKRLKEIDVIYKTGEINIEIGNNEKAIFYLTFIKDFYEKGQSVKDQRYLNTLIEIAYAYKELSNYTKALEIILQVVELEKDLLGENNQDYLTELGNLAFLYTQKGDYNMALETELKVTSKLKEVLGEKHPDYYESLVNLSSSYSKVGDFRKALEVELLAVELGREIWGEKDSRYLTSLSNLALIYVDLGEYQKALEINLKNVETYKRILGEKNPTYIRCLGNLAFIYGMMGDYQKAVDINLKVIGFKKEILGEKNPDYISTLSNLARNYQGLGEFVKALETNIRVVELRKLVLGEMHPLYFSSLSILAGNYSSLGDYKKALEINLRVVEFAKNVLGEENPAYSRTLTNLGLTYSNIGDYNKAIELFKLASELSIKLLGKRHPDYLLGRANLAYGYNNIGDYNKALEINLEIIGVEKEVFGEKHPYYNNTLANIAFGYSRLENYPAALNIYQNIVKIEKEVYGETHPMYIEGLLNLSITEFQLFEKASALDNFSLVLNIVQERVTKYFSLMTEKQRELFWKQYSRHFNRYPMFNEETITAKPTGACNAYNIALFSKGLLLNTTLDFDQLIAEKGAPEAIAKYDELKILKLEIQRLTEKPIAERYLNADSLENIAQQKETELVKLSKEYGDYTSNLKVNWKDVQANLQDKDVAIEFVEYPTLTDTVKYAALVLRKGWQYPRMISLFRKDQVDDFIKQDKDIIYSKYVGKELKNLIWIPLEQVVSPGERVYFSPAGIIHQLAIENLPFDDSTTLGDRYQMYRLSSTKELALHKAESKSNIAALYGGLQYDLPEEKMLAESKKYEMPETIYAMRGYTNDSALRSGWKYLDGTKPEVDKISQLMKEKLYLVNEYSGAVGNEESFKSLSGKKEGIIHIATHGFFLPIEESRKNSFIMQRMGEQQQERATVDPMFRSGLILAGGNKAWQGEKIPDNIEDGVLTAKEISRMDLQGTDLVVLSACETGLGEVSSEGVFGLQRSFKQAGVQTLVMSLWQVNDEATRYLMTAFYSGLLGGKDKRAAFLEAKQKCKKKYPEPRYWAAFIMLD